MPIFEYTCNKCSADFELLVFSYTKTSCPQCSADDIKKKLSIFGMSGSEKSSGAGSGGGCGGCQKNSCSAC